VGGRLASWSKADPGIDVVRPRNKNREGREGRKGKKGLLGKLKEKVGEVDGEDGNSERRQLLEESVDPQSAAAQRQAQMDKRREEMRAQKQKEIRDRYKDRAAAPEPRRERDPADFDPERYMREREARYAGRGGDAAEDYLSARHQELRDRHRSRDRNSPSSRDRSGRRDRKRPDSEGRHAVLQRRFDKHAHLFTPAELAEIDDEMKEHKKREDKLDAARDKLNSEFDAVRDIDDRDARLARLEQLKQKRAAGRDADRAARDKLREEFQLIRERLEAKLRTEL
jgi:hypothetical protein